MMVNGLSAMICLKRRENPWHPPKIRSSEWFYPSLISPTKYPSGSYGYNRSYAYIIECIL